MLKEDWGIDIGILLPNYQNNEGSFLLYRYENHLLNRAGEFEGEEQDLIVEMMRILRNHTKKEKKEMEELEKDMRRFVGLVNPFKNRYLLFTRCKNYMQNN